LIDTFAALQIRKNEWGKIFSDQAMTLAAIDRLVHHATILEMNVESYRRKAALKRKRGPGN
jgi:DNA replication protein DnaC